MPDIEKNPLYQVLLRHADAYADSKTRSLRDLGSEERLRGIFVDSLSLTFERLADFEETVRYMAENAHQAYHDVPCGWWECKKNICTAAQLALPNFVNKLTGEKP